MGSMEQMNSSDLKNRAIKSLAWYTGTRLWTQMLSWGVTVFLARLLTPSDYGLFAMAFAVITLIELLQEFGLGVSIIQRQDLRPEHVNAIFWITSSASLVVALVGYGLAHPAALFYHEPKMVWIIRALCLTFVLNSAATVPYSLLTKELDFRSRSLAEAYGVIASAAASLALAYWGFGVWALVAGQVARAAVRNAGLFIYAGWRPLLQVKVRGLKELVTFGLRIAGAGGILSLLDGFNTAMIGRLIGDAGLGYYNMADTLGKGSPVHKLSTSILNQVSLPMFSKLQQQNEQLRHYFLKITKYLAVISLPTQIGMFLVSRDVVNVVLGNKWLPIVGVLQIFCVGGILYVVVLPCSPILTAKGRANTLFKFAAVTGPILTIALFTGTYFGLLGVAVAWFIVFLVTRACLLLLVSRDLCVSLRQYLRNVQWPAFATIIMAVAVLITQSGIRSLENAPLRLTISVSVGTLFYSAVLFVVDRQLRSEMAGLVNILVPVKRGSLS